MKWPADIISGQNLFLKLAIFITGLVSGLESSLRQLLSQLILFLLFLFLEPSLFTSLYKAVRRILPFLAGYWVFAQIFGQAFPDSVFFSLQIVYLLLISVYVMGRLKPELVAGDSVSLRRLGFIQATFFFAMATSLYLKSFFSSYARVQKENSNASLLSLVSQVLQDVSAETERIRERVNDVLSAGPCSSADRHLANICGVVFLTFLVLLHSL